MEPLSGLASINKDLQLLPEDEQAGESSPSQTLQYQILMESNDPFNLERCSEAEMDKSHCFSREVVEAEHDEQPGNVETKDLKIARALATVTLEAFNAIDWEYVERSFRECLNEFHSFKDEVFDAMAHFAWNLYNEEDLENIAFTDDIFNECEEIWKSVCSKGKFELDSLFLDVSKYEKVREQDVCNIFKWCKANKSRNKNELKEFSGFKSEVLLHPNLSIFYESDFERYVRKSRDVMLTSDNLDPKGTVKQQLRVEVHNRKRFCIVDALYMQSWKYVNYINMQKLEAFVSCHDKLEDLVSDIHSMLYELVVTRGKRLRKCESLVTYPLSSNIFGSWDHRVQEVIKLADLKRRSEGRRFIGRDHLVFCLHQMLVSESPNNSKLETDAKHKGEIGERLFTNPSTECILLPCQKNSKLMMSTDDEEKHKNTVYHLYRKAYKIATQLGYDTIGVEHLYAAITSTNDDESSWKDSLDCARMAKVRRKGKCNEEDEPHTGPWNIFLEDGSRTIAGSVLAVVKEIKDENNIHLQNAISDILFKVDERPHQMSEGEMIYSLKKNIEFSRS